LNSFQSRKLFGLPLLHDGTCTLFLIVKKNMVMDDLFMIMYLFCVLHWFAAASSNFKCSSDDNTCLQVGWGEATMIEAERLLLSAALQDPLNLRFLLLSDRYFIYICLHEILSQEAEQKEIIIS
jgi:hypothetical protein